LVNEGISALGLRSGFHSSSLSCLFRGDFGTGVADIPLGIAWCFDRHYSTVAASLPVRQLPGHPSASRLRHFDLREFSLFHQISACNDFTLEHKARYSLLGILGIDRHHHSISPYHHQTLSLCNHEISSTLPRTAERPRLRTTSLLPLSLRPRRYFSLASRCPISTAQ
jgi:hypothetical protein